MSKAPKMTGPECYAEALRLVTPETRKMNDDRGTEVEIRPSQYDVERAQVYATLAVAAAQVEVAKWSLSAPPALWNEVMV